MLGGAEIWLRFICVWGNMSNYGEAAPIRALTVTLRRLIKKIKNLKNF
jgi:hypothetical protein